MKTNPRNSRIIEAINSGEGIKVAAYDLGISRGWAYKVAQELGYYSVLVNRAEQKLLTEFRKTQATK